MPLSVFDVIGPAMIGPSSSHTAGAIRLGLIARALSGEKITGAEIFLHGSFAATGKGHATDRAIVAGLLGYGTDDERLENALEIAAAQNIGVKFFVEDFGENFHPNTARILIKNSGCPDLQITGSSIGGGAIRVLEINGYETHFSGDLDTVVLWHRDYPGFLAKITTLLACVETNIATIQTARRSRNNDALTLIEIDAPLPPDLIGVMRRIASVERVIQISKLA